jgi:HEAT repeat protein
MSSESKPVSQNTPETSRMPFAEAFSSNNAPASAAQGELTLPEYLALPTWIAQALDAPEVSVRLGALDTWAQQGPQAPMDPLIVALDDENDDVREKAMAIIEQHWVVEQDGEPQR